jgi:hypothetical protein
MESLVLSWLRQYYKIKSRRVILQVFLNFSFPKLYNMRLWIALSLALVYILALPNQMDLWIHACGLRKLRLPILRKETVV